MGGDLGPLFKVVVWETNTAMVQSQPLSISKSLSCARHRGKSLVALPSTLPSKLDDGEVDLRKYGALSQVTQLLTTGLVFKAGSFASQTPYLIIGLDRCLGL